MPVKIDWSKIEWLMEKRNISGLDELAGLVGMHRGSLYRIAQGNSLPNMNNLGRLCLHLGAQPGEILSYEMAEEDFNPKFFIFDDKLAVDEKKWKKFLTAYADWANAVGLWKGGDYEPDIRKREQIHLRAMLAFSELEISESEFQQVCASEKYREVIEIFRRESGGDSLALLNATGAEYDKGQHFYYNGCLIALFFAPMDAQIACMKNLIASMRAVTDYTGVEALEQRLEEVNAEFEILGEDRLPTVAIQDEHKEGDYILINARDFDWSQQKLWMGPWAPLFQLGGSTLK